MKQSDFLNVLVKHTGTSKAEAKRFLDAFSETLKSSVQSDGEVTINGIGKFVSRVRPAKMGFNPKTKEKIEVPAKTLVQFKPSKDFKDLLNQ